MTQTLEQQALEWIEQDRQRCKQAYQDYRKHGIQSHPREEVPPEHLAEMVEKLLDNQAPQQP